MIGSPLLGRLTGPAEIVGRNEKKGCAAGEAVHSNEWKYISIYTFTSTYLYHTFMHSTHICALYIYTAIYIYIYLIYI